MDAKGSGAVRRFVCMEKQPAKLMNLDYRLDIYWAKEYRGKAKVVYGHSPVPEPEWLNRTNLISIPDACLVVNYQLFGIPKID